ncbi:MAG: restriction endonuclease subunit S [Bacteroidaceae bacterium]|nr:restriction endonuclease subunit S [Bacteroidaceae bacterium]
MDDKGGQSMREMKDSGIAWIGEIPREWEVRKNKYMLESIYSGGTPTASNSQYYDDGGVPFVSISDMSSSQYILDTKKHLSEKGIVDSRLKIVKKGTILYSIYATVGAVSELKVDATISQAIIALYINDCVDKKFYKFALNAIKDFILLYANGNTQFNLNADKVLNFSFPLPPLSEQHLISSYLDAKCSEIDSALSLQEQMISELRAYKQSLITETVTHGLNPNAKMKNSGVEWIGDVPEHWSTPKLSHLTSKIGSGSTPHGGSEIYVSQGIKFLRSQNVLNEGLSLDDVAYITEDIDDEMAGTRVQVDDILFNITGGSIGRCYYVDESLGRANVNQHVCIVRPNGIGTKYLLYYLQSEKGQHQVRIRQTGGNRDGLSAAAFKEFVITLPPDDEQQAIASFLDEKCAEIDALIVLREKKMEALKEYKKSLIYECVTGKKQVI